jgi:hypothetical protein
MNDPPFSPIRPADLRMKQKKDPALDRPVHRLYQVLHRPYPTNNLYHVKTQSQLQVGTHL